MKSHCCRCMTSVLENMAVLAPRGKTEFRHLLAQPLSITTVQQRNELLVFSCQGIFFMEKKYIKIPNYSIYISHVFSPNCVPIATQSICFPLSSELFSIMSPALLVRQTVCPLK